MGCKMKNCGTKQIYCPISTMLFTKKGEILSCKSVKPCKNRKNSRAYYVRTRDKSGSNSPPFKRNVQIPPFPGTMHSQMPGGGGMLKFRIDRRKTFENPRSGSKNSNFLACLLFTGQTNHFSMIKIVQ